MPANDIPFMKMVEARSLRVAARWEEVRKLCKEIVAELPEDDVVNRMTAAAMIVEGTTKVILNSPNRSEMEVSFYPELRRYTQMAVDAYDKASSEDRRSFDIDYDIDKMRVVLKQDEQRSKKAGACFIATAAYGSPLAPEVLIFRRLRDEVLLNSRVGALVVAIYYRVSPPLARCIGRSKLSKKAARAFLKPLVRLAEFKTQALLGPLRRTTTQSVRRI